MTVLAFTYKTYYCYGIRDSFRGHYNDATEACYSILGGRGHGNYHEHLETIDTETFAIKHFYWKHKYDLRTEYNPTRYFLTGPWDDKTEFEIEVNEGRLPHHSPLVELDPRYSQGYWSHRDD